MLEAGGPHHKINSSIIVNQQLQEIEQDLSRNLNSSSALIHYLLGVVQRERNKT